MKKGQLHMDNLIGIVLAMVLIGVLLGATVLIMDDGFADVFQTTVQASENFTLADNQTTTITNSNFFGQIEAIAVYNWSAAGVAARTLLDDGNYTIDYATGVLTPAVAGEYNGTEAEIEYTYWIGSYPYNATIDVLTAQSEIGDWLDLVVIIAIAAVIILLIMRFGTFSSKR